MQMLALVNGLYAKFSLTILKMNINNDQRVVAATLSSPEISYLAAELSGRGVLIGFVRRYANLNRGWERVLAGVPMLGDIYNRTFGRRTIPEDLNKTMILEAGVFWDFLAAIVVRSGGLCGYSPNALGDLLFLKTERAISKKVATVATRASIVVASQGMALSAFLSGKRKKRLVLNYSSAHHRYRKNLFDREAAVCPEFAGILTKDSISVDYQTRLDTECELADLILTGSEFARSTFIEEGFDPSKILAVPYGVDLQRFTPGNRKGSGGKFRVLYVGRISQNKGLGYLLQAYQRFCRPDTELHLVGNFIGDTECLSPYREFFVHTPNVPQAMLPDIYRQADVFVFPSLLEGMGMVVLEAMACGCPVIVTDRGPNEVVTSGRDGFVVAAGRADKIADCLETLYRDRERHKEMGAAARIGAEKYSWQRYANLAANAVLQH